MRKVDEALREAAFINASAHFLTDQVPSNWFEMELEECDEFVESHAWEPLEGWPATSVIDVIDAAATATINFMVAQGIVEKELLNEDS